MGPKGSEECQAVFAYIAHMQAMVHVNDSTTLWYVPRAIKYVLFI